MVARPGDPQATQISQQSQVNIGCHVQSQFSVWMSNCSITLPKGTLPVFGGPAGSQQGTHSPRRGSGGEVTQSSVSGQLSSAIEYASHKPVFSPPHPQHNHDLIVKKTVNNYSWLFALLVAAHNDFSTIFKSLSKGCYEEILEDKQPMLINPQTEGC